VKRLANGCTVQYPGECREVYTQDIHEGCSLHDLKATIAAAAPFISALSELTWLPSSMLNDSSAYHDCEEEEAEWHDPQEHPSEPLALRIQALSSGQVFRNEECHLKEVLLPPVMHPPALAVSALLEPDRWSANTLLLRVALRAPTGHYGEYLTITIDSSPMAVSSTVLAEKLGPVFGIPPESVLLAKRETPLRWKLLRDVTKKKGGKKNGAGRAIPNLLKAPWSITDGTFLGIKDVSIEEHMQEDEFVSVTDLPESKIACTHFDAPGSLMRTREVALSIR